MQVKSLPIKLQTACLVAACLLTIPAFAYEELIFHLDNNQFVRGQLQNIPRNYELFISSRSGPVKVSVDNIAGIYDSAMVQDYQKLVQATNYKELSRKGLLDEYNLQKNTDEPFWQKLDGLWAAQKPDSFLVIGYKVAKNGDVGQPVLYQGSGNDGLDGETISLLGGVKFAPLPTEYSGQWLPGFIVINPVIIKQHLFLSALESALQPKIAKIPAGTPLCSYRIRLLYSATGEPVYTRAFASKRENSAIKSCALSDQDPVIAALSKEKHPGFSWPQDDLLGLSLWLDRQKSGEFELRAAFDPDFARESVASVIHRYIYYQMDPALKKYFHQLRKKKKVKLDNRATRHARYLITFSPKTWPNLKDVILTTTSGDKAFDELCAQSLKETALPEFPDLMNAQDQRTVYRCELWGRD